MVIMHVMVYWTKGALRRNCWQRECETSSRPQGQVQRHTVEQLADFAPMVQILDVPEPQVVDQLVAVIKLSVPEQKIEVPKILCPSRPLRAAHAATQMAGQLVEVPTDVVLVVLRQPVEQIVDIPVPGIRGSSGSGGLQGFLPEQSFPHSSVEQIVDTPVPGRGSSGRSLTFQFPVAAFMIFSQIRVQQVGFSHFSPGGRKCEGHQAGECQSRRGLQLIRAVVPGGGVLHRRCWWRVDAHGHWPLVAAWHGHLPC